MRSAAFSVGTAHVNLPVFFLRVPKVRTELEGSMKARLESTGPDILKDW